MPVKCPADAEPTDPSPLTFTQPGSGGRIVPILGISLKGGDGKKRKKMQLDGEVHKARGKKNKLDIFSFSFEIHTTLKKKKILKIKFTVKPEQK